MRYIRYIMYTDRVGLKPLSAHVKTTIIVII